MQQYGRSYTLVLTTSSGYLDTAISYRLDVWAEQDRHHQDLGNGISCLPQEFGYRQRSVTSDTPATAPAANWYMKGSGRGVSDILMVSILDVLVGF